MKTSTQAAIIRLITNGTPPVSKTSIAPAEWVKIILCVIREMRDVLSTSLLFRKLTEPLFDCNWGVKGIVNNWRGWGQTGNQKDRNRALEKATLPKDITPETMVVCLWSYPTPGKEGGRLCKSEVLITNQGTLLLLERKYHGSGLSEVVHSVTLRFFTASEMREVFDADTDGGYWMLYHLEELAHANAKLAGQEAKEARKLKFELEAKLALIKW